MAWHNGGTWSGLELRPGARTVLEELCTAVGEREAALSLGGAVAVTSITRSGSTATIQTTTGHGIAQNATERVFIYGADQSDYNGIHSATAIHTGTIPDITSITRVGTTATVTCGSPHYLEVGDSTTIAGCTESEYNGTKTVTAKTSTTFSYTVSGSPTTPSGDLPSVSSITRSGTTATVTFGSAHGLTTSNVIRISGCTQSEYNGTKAITATPTSTTLTYTVSGSPATPATGSPLAKSGNPTGTALPRLQYTVSGTPATPATGTIVVARASTQFHYDKDFNAKRFPADTDFEDMPVHHVTAAAQTVTSIVQSLGTMYVRLPGHGRRVGDYVKIAGANEDGYNGEFTVTSVPGSISLTSITRSGSTATATAFSAHGLATGDIVYIAGADQSAYNGAKSVTVTSSTVFTYAVSGSPATPATGTITMKDYSRFEYTSTSLAPSATGTITAQGRRTHIYYAEWSGGTGTVYARNHGFSIGQWVHIQHDSDSSWRLWVKVASVSSHDFTFAHSGSLSTATYSSTAGFWCARPCGIRIVAQQMRSAIETMLDTDRFVVDDGATYDTPYTLTSALTAGTFGSSWISLVNCERNAVGDVLEQIREVLELMVFIRATVESDGHDGLPQQKLGTGSTQTASYNDMVADTPFDGVASSTVVFIRQSRNSGTTYSTSAGISSTINYLISQIPGMFVYGKMYLAESNNGDVDCDAVDVEDGDGDIWTMDAALGSSFISKELEKPESFFGAPTKQLTFDLTVPVSHPFDALTPDDASARSLSIAELILPEDGYHVRDISAVLTYG